ncbi:MAG TPA: DNA-3-methyladenine glycosylase [Candidatus Paceibacterota bacterium]|jgi:DNA-3-methyladenine glycosylase|nr:DNA-3-methyladenine glycosylase [Candidatus Paceibacterota bacterium]
MSLLTRDFFERDALSVARDLIGCYLVRKIGGKREARMIVETEAYIGPEDLASHASKGLTPRTAVMFGPGGVWYVYFIYGMHEMLNIVTGPEGFPSAVLIRGIEGAIGPGRLTKALGITRELNKLPAARKTGLWIEAGEKIPDKLVKRTPRIGVAYAGAEWAGKPYRFVLKNRTGLSR